jgi:hypothetical protein
MHRLCDLRAAPESAADRARHRGREGRRARRISAGSTVILVFPPGGVRLAGEINQMLRVRRAHQERGVSKRDDDSQADWRSG